MVIDEVRSRSGSYSYLKGETQFSVIEPKGNIDTFTAVEFRNQVIDVIGSEPKLLLIDLQDVEEIDGAGVRALVFAFNRVRFFGGVMALCCASGQPKALFDLAKMYKVFQIFSTRADFLTAMPILSDMLSPFSDDINFGCFDA